MNEFQIKSAIKKFIKKGNRIVLHFPLLKKLKNLCLVVIKILYCSNNSVCHCSQLDFNDKNCFVWYSSLHKAPLHKQLQHNYSTDLCNGDIQIKITLFKRTASSHKTDWTSLTQSPTLSCLLYDNEESLMIVRFFAFLKSLQI